MRPFDPTSGYYWVPTALLLGIWLVLLAHSDLRTRTTPAWATAIPLLAAGLFRSLVAPPDGAFWPGGVAAGCALAMILLSDTGLGVYPAGLALLCAGLAGPESQALVGGWVAALILTLLGIWGAGDGKIFATLVALFPDVRMVIALVLAIAMGSSIALLRKYGGTTPVALMSVLGDALHLRFPSKTGEQGNHPAVPFLALGAFAYLGLRVGGVL
jgi:Flp pilus assembly protein protease CpaA